MQEQLQCKNIYDVKKSAMEEQLQFKNIYDVEEATIEQNPWGSHDET